MPTVLRSGPYRFYFYSHEPNEPPHIHVERDDLSAKFWLDPVALARNFGFSAGCPILALFWLGWAENRITGAGEPGAAFGGVAWVLAIAADERVADVSFTDDTLSVRLKDGRTISVPLTWYPRLLHAPAEQRRNWKIAGGGYGIHWHDLDEDLSTEGLLRGAPAPRVSRST